MKADDESVFADLFRAHFRSVRRYLSALVRTPEIADELAQEAFARTYSSARSNTIESPRYFLFRTARNLALNHLVRQQAVTFEHLEDRPGFEIGDEAPSVERWLSAREELELVRTVIAELPPKCRQVFLLLRLQGLSTQEVAREMGLSETMVRKYVTRALNHCQTRLAHLRS
jgi:RNA polymerase sigma-70 factor (ECF subfamily)